MCSQFPQVFGARHLYHLDSHVESRSRSFWSVELSSSLSGVRYKPYHRQTAVPWSRPHSVGKQGRESDWSSPVWIPIPPRQSLPARIYSQGKRGSIPTHALECHIYEASTVLVSEWRMFSCFSVGVPWWSRREFFKNLKNFLLSHLFSSSVSPK